MKLSKTIPFLALTALFFIDIASFSLLEHNLIQLILAYYIVHLFAQTSAFWLIFISFLLCLESFLYFDQFGPPLIYLIPITIGAAYTQRILQMPFLQKTFFLITAITIQTIYLEWSILGIKQSFFYTIGKYFVNIIVVFFMSLIVTSQGKQGDRF